MLAVQRSGALSRRVLAGFNGAVAALGVASIAATALALAARFWWIAELATHFRVQLVAAQIGLLVALFGAGRHRLATAVAAAALVNWIYIQPVVWPEVRAADWADEPLNVMSVNLSARNDDAQRLLAIIERERPDLILAVELTPLWRDALAALPGAYAYRELVVEDGPFGLGLYSRYPITDANLPELGATPTLDARVAAPGGTFRVLGLHLLPPMSARLAAERNRQLERLAAHAASIREPLVVLGDFNLSPYSPHYGEWVRTTGLVDSLAGHGPSATWPTFLPMLGIPIDHCLVSTHFEIVDRRHLPEFGSDHYPVLVSLLQETRR